MDGGCGSSGNSTFAQGWQAFCSSQFAGCKHLPTDETLYLGRGSTEAYGSLLSGAGAAVGASMLRALRWYVRGAGGGALSQLGGAAQQGYNSALAVMNSSPMVNQQK